MIRIGSLDRRITILKPGAPTFDGLQTLPGTLEPLVSIWANYKPVSDGERERGNIDSVKADARFTIRYRADVDETCAVLFDGLHFQITRKKEIGRRQWLELTTAAESRT